MSDGITRRADNFSYWPLEREDSTMERGKGLPYRTLAYRGNTVWARGGKVGRGDPEIHSTIFWSDGKSRRKTCKEGQADVADET